MYPCGEVRREAEANHDRQRQGCDRREAHQLPISHFRWTVPTSFHIRDLRHYSFIFALACSAVGQILLAVPNRQTNILDARVSGTVCLSEAPASA